MSKCDATTAISFLEQLIEFEVLTNKEFKIITKRIYDGCTAQVANKYIPVLEKLRSAIKDI